jgi:hypothetical protein
MYNTPHERDVEPSPYATSKMNEFEYVLIQKFLCKISKLHKIKNTYFALWYLVVPKLSVEWGALLLLIRTVSIHRLATPTEVFRSFLQSQKQILGQCLALSHASFISEAFLLIINNTII